MDLQDVANLTIPEGGVKTIHDKDNRLLWGAVGYDTKYAGNTTQNGEPTPDAPVTVNVVTGVQNVQVHGKNLCKAVSVSSNNRNLYFSMVRPSSATITLSATINQTLTGNSIYLNIDGTNYGVITTMSGTAGQLQKKTITFTEAQMQLIENATSITLYIYRSGGGFVAPTDGQIEEGSPATTYESFQSQTYTIDLGSTELCKLGTYQDYIYKSGDDWYVHKTTNKITFDGGDDETWWAETVGGVPRYYHTNVADAMTLPATNVMSPMKSNYYAPTTPSNLYNAVVDYGISLNSGTAKFRVRNKDVTSIANFKTWLSNNNTTVYYPLATPTDTKITDATLTSQLNAVHEWLTRYGYNATVTGNLPIIIDRTNL